jgi:hypothetical protein
MKAKERIEEDWPDVIGDADALESAGFSAGLELPLEQLSSDQLVEVIEARFANQEGVLISLGNRVQRLAAENKVLRRRLFRWREVAVFMIAIVIVVSTWLGLLLYSTW